MLVRRADFVLLDASWHTAVVSPSLAVVHRLGVSPHDGYRPWMFVFLQELDQALEEDESLILGANLLHPSVPGKIVYNNLPGFQMISRKENVKI